MAEPDGPDIIESLIIISVKAVVLSVYVPNSFYTHHSKNPM